MDEEEEYGDEDMFFVRRFSFCDLLGVWFAFCKNLLVDMAMACDDVANLIAGHANYRTQQRVFREEARMDIESIATTED